MVGGGMRESRGAVLLGIKGSGILRGRGQQERNWGGGETVVGVYS